MSLPFALIGGILIVIGLALIGWEFRQRSGSTPTVGRVIGHSLRDGLSGKFFRAVVECRGQDGRLRWVESSTGSSTPLGRVGDERTIFLRFSEPEFAHLASTGIWWVAAILVILGSVLMKFFVPSAQEGGISLWVGLGFSAFFFGPAAAKLYSLFQKFREAQQNPALRPKGKTLVKTKRVYFEGERDQLALAKPEAAAPLNNRLRKNSRAAAMFFGIFGLGLAGLGTHLYQKTHRFLQTAERAQGTVVDLKVSRTSKGSTYKSIVEFVPVPSQGPIQFENSFSTYPPLHSVGEAVTVLYPPADPAQARIDLGRWNQAFAYGCWLLALIFLLGAWKTNPPSTTEIFRAPTNREDLQKNPNQAKPR